MDVLHSPKLIYSLFCSSSDSFAHYSRSTNEYIQPPPHANIGVAPPSYTAAQGRTNSQPFYAAHGSIFRTQLPATAIANWQQNDSYKISPQGPSWHGNFTDHGGFAYRSFAKVEAPHEWMGGIGPDTQDYPLRQSGHLHMAGDEQDLASVTKISRGKYTLLFVPQDLSQTWLVLAYISAVLWYFQIWLLRKINRAPVFNLFEKLRNGILILKLIYTVNCGQNDILI